MPEDTKVGPALARAIFPRYLTACIHYLLQKSLEEELGTSLPVGTPFKPDLTLFAEELLKLLEKFVDLQPAPAINTACRFLCDGTPG